eukprot:10223-Heterococcus_DN1.PRE.1
MTAAPLSIVAIRMSCPGQSTKLTCRCRCHSLPFSVKVSACALPLEQKLPSWPATAPSSALKIFALA